MSKREEVAKLAYSWVGKNEKDGSYKSIIDVYNSYLGALPRNIKMKYSWPWCACFWSSIAIYLGYTNIMPIEISCDYLIQKASDMGIWVEDDAYIPNIADAVLYDWDDNGSGDNRGSSDHVGVIIYVDRSSGYMKVVEGNKNDAVGERTLTINGRYIRGFITPKYDKSPVVKSSDGKKSIEEIANEVIIGLWDVGLRRIYLLEAAGYDATRVQDKVNEILNTPDKENPLDPYMAECKATKFKEDLKGCYVTKEKVQLRHGPGNSYKSLAVIPKGSKVYNYGYFSKDNNNRGKWLYVQYSTNDLYYIGFIKYSKLEPDNKKPE